DRTRMPRRAGSRSEASRGSRRASSSPIYRVSRAWAVTLHVGFSSMLVSINSDHPEPRKVRRAVDALLAGEVIAYPTDTVYGLGCDIASKKAIDKLYAIKGMDRSHPLAFLCPDLAEIAKLAIVDNQIYRVLR